MCTFPYTPIKGFIVITLIGPHQSKRTHYFMQAAAVLGESVTALTHPQALDASLTSGIVKIDPPVHSETDIRKINAIGLDYIHFLQNMAARPGVTWLTIRRASFTCWIKNAASGAYWNTASPRRRW